MLYEPVMQLNISLSSGKLNPSQENRFQSSKSPKIESFSFLDHVNLGLSKTCLKNLYKYEAIKTSQAAREKLPTYSRQFGPPQIGLRAT